MGTKAKCDTDTGACKACDDDAQCSGIKEGSKILGKCDNGECKAECSSDSECTAGSKTKCATETGACVECTTDSDCTGGDSSACDAAGTCKCGSNAKCPGATPKCGTNDTCKECTADPDCTGGSNKCVSNTCKCGSNAKCTGSALCNASTGNCEA